MVIKLSTVEEIDFGLAFLKDWRKGHLRASWKFGPVTENRSTGPIVNGPGVVIRRYALEADMAEVLKATQQAAVSVVVKDKKGNPVTEYESAVWGVSDPNLLAVEPDPADAAKATVKAVGPVGSAQLNLQIDGIKGEGERVITAIAEVEIIPGDAETVEIHFEPAEEQP